jgi:hypothetical protein
LCCPARAEQDEGVVIVCVRHVVPLFRALDFFVPPSPVLFLLGQQVRVILINLMLDDLFFLSPFVRFSLVSLAVPLLSRSITAETTRRQQPSGANLVSAGCCCTRESTVCVARADDGTTAECQHSSKKIKPRDSGISNS